MLNAVVTSDLHLDGFNTSRLCQFFPDRTDIAYQINELDKVFTYATENGIPNVFILGDIGDAPTMSSVAISQFLMLLIKYDGVLNTHIILGNHDTTSLATNSMNIIDVLCKNKKFDSTYFYKEPTVVNIGGVKCKFIPFPYTDLENGVLNLCHLDINGAKRDNGVSVRGVDPVDSPIISGHIHKYQKFENTVYCGSLYQTDFGSHLPKGFIHVKAKQDDVRHRFIKNQPKYTFKNVEVERDEDFTFDKDPFTLYKIKVAPHVIPPPDLRNRFPNIVDIDNSISIQAVEQTDIGIDPNIEDFLKEYGLSDEQIIRATELVKQGMSKI